MRRHDQSVLFPQVYHVRNKMDKVGLDMLLDIHGDEELPYNFINGNEVGITDRVHITQLFAHHLQLAQHLL